MSEKIPQSFEKKESSAHLNRQLLYDKLVSIRQLSIDELGSLNLADIAAKLYESLYSPEEFSEKHEIIEPLDEEGKPRFDRRKFIESDELELSQGVVPSKEEFIKAARSALSKAKGFEQAVFDEAPETLKKLSELGPIVIWTQGDVTGLRDDEGNQILPGSHGQLKKISRAGIGQLRRELTPEGGDKRDVVRVAVDEDKFGLLEKKGGVLEKFSEKGIKKVVIIEDNARFLTESIESIERFSKETGREMESFPVWCRQDDNVDKIPKGKEPEEVAKELNAVDRIGDVMGLIKESEFSSFKGEDEIGIICDFDGVIMEREAHLKAQVDSLIEVVNEKGWAPEGIF